MVFYLYYFYYQKAFLIPLIKNLILVNKNKQTLFALLKSVAQIRQNVVMKLN